MPGGNQQSGSDQIRRILHADLDAFFASVEQLENPELRGKPVLVAGTGPRGVVAAASYEARKYGCRSAMPTAVALRSCPHAIVVKPSGKYREYSDRVFGVFESLTPLIQPLSLDEAFLDVTGSVRAIGSAEDMARTIRARVRDEIGLAISVGVATSKFIAKLASDLAKPDGMLVVPPGTEREMLAPLPVTRIFGIGESAAKRLARFGVRTIGDLAEHDPETLESALGSFAARAVQLARGIDERPVVPDRIAKSIGHERTFAYDLEQPDQVRAVLVGLVENAARRLRRKGGFASSVSLKIRYGDFTTISRAERTAQPTDETSELWSVASSIFDKWARESFRPVRLIGVSLSDLREAGETSVQPGLFDSGLHDKRRALDKAQDLIAEKFGKDAIRRARGVSGPKQGDNWADDPGRGTRRDR